ncbi:MAG: LamG domain-containing protein [Planctomycetota bacterium]
MRKKLIFSVSLLFVLGSAWTSRTRAADPGLIGWWKFDEGSGTTAADASGHDVHGVLVNGPVWRQDGVHNGCLFFDGDQAHVRITNQDSLNPAADSFTFAFWAYLEPAPGTQGSTNWDLAVAKRDTGSAGYYVGADRNQGSADQSGYRFMLGDTAANRKDTPYLPVPLGEWVFVAAVLDRDRNAQEISVDGGQTWATTTPPPGPIAPTEDLGIGWDIGQNNYWFHGRIDDVRLYNWALSAKEILIVREGGEGFPLARRPDPEDGAVLGATWVNLLWIPGSFAISHDLYFGASFDDVNNGAADTFVGNLSMTSQIVGFPGFPAPEGLVPGTTYYWRVDEVNDADPNSPWKGDIWSFTVQPKIAYNPTPPDGARFMVTDVILSWTAGFGAKLHTVYFGNNFEDVSAASGGTSQPATTYVPGPLELGETYYWRVDEFDAVTTHRGDIWSFTTRPAISIVDPNLVGWWAFDEGYGTTALDWSGHENHATLINGPQWVEGYFDGALEFDGSNYVTMDPVADNITSNDITLSGWVKTTDTHGLWLSCNTASRGNVALWSIDNSRATMYDGSDSTYEGYSNTVVSDGKWHLLTYVRTGSTGYIYVDGFMENTHAAGYSFSATDLWSVAQEWDAGGPSDFLIGIVDDVRIYDMALTQVQVVELMRGDLLLAWNPSPANGSTPDIGNATPLSWSPGDTASEHDVYFGTDKDAVIDADASDTTGIYRGRQSTATYNPPEGVEWGGGPYYWRIDEHNTDGTVSAGRAWDFTVADFITVDDFESYDDIDPLPGEPGINRIFDKWIDGFGTTTNGALVGNDLPPYTERIVVHSGSQAMIYRYDNAGKTSEATLTLVYPRDWTEQGVTKLSLWANGSAANAADRIYVALNGTAVVYHEDSAATQIEGWTEWVIDLTRFADQGVNLANVNTITIGIGTKNSPAAGGTGTMYFDDIRLYR